jgi:hypothetical protein
MDKRRLRRHTLLPRFSGREECHRASEQSFIAVVARRLPTEKYCIVVGFGALVRRKRNPDDSRTEIGGFAQEVNSLLFQEGKRDAKLLSRGVVII